MDQRSIKSWKSGDEVVGQFDFIGKSKEDLSFQKGDILTVVNPTTDPKWYKARNSSGKIGVIPVNHVQQRKVVTLHAMPWYHGKISRAEAEKLLTPRDDGLFLIRDSNNYVGDYTLCISFHDKVEHYHIKYSDNLLSLDNEEFFKNLDDLVQFYTEKAEGLCSRLVRPLVKQGDNYGGVSMADFKRSGWTIALNDLELGELIGKGDFGDVFKGTYKGEKIAAKQLKDRNRGGQAFLQEASVMTSLRHPNLIKLIGIVMEQTIFLVTEYMGKGNLMEYLRSRGRSVISKEDQMNFAIDTCAAMDYLEKKGLVHRDLAARNVLLDDNGAAKVSDFGLAKFGDFSLSNQKFPVKWTAPESLRHSNFTNKSDMWSFGILLWEIYSFARAPYPRIPQAEVVVQVEKGYRMEAPDGCPEEVYSIMRQAWQFSPEDRPTFNQVLSQLHDLRWTTVR